MMFKGDTDEALIFPWLLFFYIDGFNTVVL